MVDTLHVFCEDFSVATDAETIVTNVLDLGANGKNHLGTTIYPSISAGGKMFLVATCDSEAFAGSATSTITFRVYTHSTTTVTSGTLVQEFTYNFATSVAVGTRLFCVSLNDIPVTARYLGVSVDDTDNDITAGKITLVLTDNPHRAT